MANVDPWATDSGLFSDYEGVIVSAGFEEGQYGCQMVFELETDIPEKPLWKEFYRCGPDWHTLDGGDTVTHREKAIFNKNSQMGKLVIAAGALAPEMKEKGSPTSADTWVGSKWYFEATVTPARGEYQESTKNYPTKFLGFQDVAGGGGGSGGSVVDPSADPLGTVTPATLAMMTLEAKGLPRDEWLDKILDIDEVRKDSRLVSACADGDTIYERLKNES